MAPSDIRKFVYVYEAYVHGWFEKVRWRLVNRVALAFNEDLSKHTIHSPLYACNDVIRLVTETLYALSAQKNQLQIHWLGLIVQGPDGRFADDRNTVRVLVEFDWSNVENAASRASGESSLSLSRTSDGGVPERVTRRVPSYADRVERSVGTLFDAPSGTTKVVECEASGDASVAIADGEIPCELPEAGRADSRLVKSEASPESVKCDGESEAGSWVDWNAAAAEVV